MAVQPWFVFEYYDGLSYNACRLVYLIMSDDKLQDVEQLLHGVPLFHNDLLGPVGQHCIPIFHTHRHGRGENLQSLPHHTTGLNGMCF